MLPEENYDRPDWRWRAVTALAVGGLLVYAITLGLLALALLGANDSVAGTESGVFFVLLVALATMLAGTAVYGALLRRVTLLWPPGILLLVLAVPWAGFWPMLVGGALVGLAAALARPQPRPEDEADETTN